MPTRSPEEERMRRSTRRKLDKVGVTAIALGCVVMAVFGLKTLVGGDSTPDSTTSGEEAFIPYETNLSPEAVIAPSTPAPSATSPTGTVGDPLAGVRRFGVAGGDNTPHKVTIKLTSDGSMYIGFRFFKGDEGYRYASKSVSISNTVNGSGPLAQVGVKYQQNASYARCQIFVDGIEIVSHTTRGTKYQVTVCTS